MSSPGFVPYETLVRLFELQSKSMQTMFEANASRERGDVRAAADAYRKSVEAGKQWLSATLEARGSFGDAPALQVNPIVSILCDALLIESDLERSLGEAARARELSEEAMDITRRHLPRADVAERERQGVGSIIAEGRFNEALVSLSNVRDVFLQEGAPAARVASVTMDIAGILEWLGDDDRALHEIAKVVSVLGPPAEGLTGSGLLGALEALLSGDLAAVENAKNATEIWKIRVELDQTKARILSARGDADEAEKLFAQVLPAVPAPAQPAIAAQIVKIRLRQRRYQDALDEAREFAPAFESPLLKPKRGVLRIYEAEALLGLNQPEEASSAAEEAISELSAYNDLDSLWKAHWVRGRALEALHQAAGALDAYAAGIGIVTSLRKAPLGFRLDSVYLRDKIPLFAAAISLAAKSGAAEACCRFIELVKSRTLAAAMGVARKAAPENDDLKQEADRLARALDAIEYEGFSAGLSDAYEQQMAERARRRAELTAERTAILERIHFADPRWRAMSEPISFDIGRIGEILASRGQSAITLWQDGDRIVAVLLKDRRCVVGETQVTPAARDALSAYMENLESEKDPQIFDLSAAFNLSADALIPPRLLAEGISPGGLLLCPHRALHLVPWSSMGYRGRRLFKHCPVGVIPNLSCLTSLAATFSANPKVGLIGAPRYAGLMGLKPLEAAEEEINAIKTIHLSAGGLVAEPFVRERATEESFWRLFQAEGASGAILHIACHGNFDRSDPMSSGLLLENGKADAAEIAAKRLSYDEVVLSACSTGRRPTVVQGVELAGDDILGLPGAFLEAGAKAILVSIPPAHDAASFVFCTLYHERRAAGRPPLGAFQDAQIEMLAAADTYPPWMWAGFTLYGA